MRFFLMRGLAGLLGVMGSGCVSAQTHQFSAIPPSPFSFSGKWDCQGGFRGGKPHRSAFTGNLILDGKWVELAEVDVAPATGYTAKYLIGPDPEHNQIIEFDANNFGAASYTSAQGWTGGVLTMTSTVSRNPQAPYAINRFLYSIVGENSFTVDWQISKTAEPQWTTADHLSCKRSA